MRAAFLEQYGTPNIELREIEKPIPEDDEALVRVQASSVNPADWYAVAGRPYVGRAAMGLRKPRSRRLGVDFAGTVEAVGKDVTHVQPGDDVFGGRSGAYAEYVCVKNAIVRMTGNITFQEAGAVGVAGLTALQALRDKGHVQPGQKVLVNGASGGVGTFAVQIAKALGAAVTGVCSTRNVDLVRSLGADHVVDYTREDFTQRGDPFDLVLDIAGSRSWSQLKRVLTPEATVVIVGAPKGTPILGPLGHVIRMKAAGIFSSQRVVFFVAKFNREDMQTLADLLESGAIRSVVERTYPLTELAAALDHLGEGHAKAKIVVTM